MRSMVRLSALMFVGAALFAAGCTAPPEGMVDMANRNYMRFAMNKPYASVAALQPDVMSGETAFGPMIGSFALADGDTVYRHVGLGATSQSSADFGVIGGGKRVSTLLRLAYFKVGPDGVVRDWAVGSVPGDQSACRHYAAGIYETCTDVAAQRQSFAVYDSVVKTSSGQPLSAWGPRRPDALPAASVQGYPAAPALPAYPGANPDADAAYTN